jgi:hypothetical protein
MLQSARMSCNSKVSLPFPFVWRKKFELFTPKHWCPQISPKKNQKTPNFLDKSHDFLDKFHRFGAIEKFTI